MKLLDREGLIVSKSRSKRIVHAPDQKQRKTRLQKPHVLLIGGYAGSGKTELGRILARIVGWPILDKDTLTRPFVEATLQILGQLPHDRESETYINTVRPREYEALIAATAENVQCGNSVIVTAPFIREFTEETWISKMQTAFTDMGATTTLIWMDCDCNTMYTYLRHRKAPRDAVKLANWSDYLAGIDTFFRPPTPHIVVNNSASSTPLRDQARELLDNIIGSESS